MLAVLCTIAEASKYLWGDDTNSKRRRTRELFQANDVKMIKDGHKFYVRKRDLLEFSGEDEKND
ncbi:hypothetical protein [uncultured Mediterranean phage uvDeep-CGR0-AD1-C123]|nr:hypothetical protein [uncultured Mediterranean phage uvDeep-CGR0-AD1-C123]